MHRRGFLLGTLASGASFFLAPIPSYARVTPCTTKLESIDRCVRLLKVNEQKLLGCQILLLTDKYAGMTLGPKIAKVERDLEKCEIQFWCEELEFKEPLHVKGCRLINDWNQEVMVNPTMFNGTFNVYRGDKLSFNYKLAIGG